MSNVSAIGEKYVFSKFLEPVTEDAREAKIAELDAWLEADDAKEAAKAAEEAKKNAEANNADTECGKACKESAEEKIARLESELEAVKEELNSVNEFKSDIKAAYAAKRYAEKQSGHHDAKKSETVPNKKGEGFKGYGHSTTPGKDARKAADYKSSGADVKFDAKGKVASRTVYYNDKDTNKSGRKTPITTAAQKKELDKSNERDAKQANSAIKKQDTARTINKVKSAVGMKVDKSSRTAGQKPYNNHVIDK